MASNQLSTTAYGKVFSEFDRLAGRVILALPCPLSLTERTELAQCNLTESDIEAINKVRPLGILRRCSQVKVQTESPLGMITWNMFGWDSGADQSKERQMDGITDNLITLRAKIIRTRLGAEPAQRLFDWLVAALTLSIEIEEARLTVQDVMSIAATAGHLRRMVPELYKLAGSPGTGSRSSAVPYGWAAFQRHRVDALTRTLAKLQLLKAHDEYPWDTVKATWPTRAHCTWPLSVAKD